MDWGKFLKSKDKKVFMKIKVLLGVIILILIGFLFLGKGIEGLVISESCCFPPDCEAENQCMLRQEELGVKEFLNFVYAGAIIFLSLITYFLIYKKMEIR